MHPCIDVLFTQYANSLLTFTFMSIIESVHMLIMSNDNLNILNNFIK